MVISDGVLEVVKGPQYQYSISIFITMREYLISTGRIHLSGPFVAISQWTARTNSGHRMNNTVATVKQMTSFLVNFAVDVWIRQNIGVLWCMPKQNICIILYKITTLVNTCNIIRFQRGQHAGQVRTIHIDECEFEQRCNCSHRWRNGPQTWQIGGLTWCY